MKYENHMVISTDTERACEIIKEPSMINILKKLLYRECTSTQ